MADTKKLTKWQTPPMGRVAWAGAALVLLAYVATLAMFASCASTTEERISARADAIEFSRVVGRRAATGGFTLSKDSLVMKETK